MLKLMKYEFRKTMFSKLILLFITALAEAAYLIGVFGKLEKSLFVGITGLFLCAVFGIIYIGIESLIVFQRDLNTKQSYMLFLTPRSSYQILGAKILENGLSIAMAGVFFAALAAIDVTTAVLYIGGLKEFLDMVQSVMGEIQMNINLSVPVIGLVFAESLASWLMLIVTGDLAIVLSATVLAGKKFSGFVSFVLYIILSVIAGKLLDLVPAMENEYLQFGLVIGLSFVIIGVMYAVAGWIMERKLSV